MSAKKNLYEHSEAKVSLYSHYLSIYLNVLANSPIKKIHLFDFFCGEGIYNDGGKGSPIVALECIENHYNNNKQTCPNIFVTFNDTGFSEIEPEKLKIERVKEFAKDIFKPDKVKIAYISRDYSELIELIIIRTNKFQSNERALMFIDPWGYKEIKPNDIKRLLLNGKTEIILFLPIYFMWRFVKKAKDEEFKGGTALRNFIGELFGSINNLPETKNQNDFIYLIQEEFKKYLDIKFVDSFKIERNSNQLFSLFFFTNYQKGFWKMLESKWALDKKHGTSFIQGDKFTLDIFDEIKLAQYDSKILKLLQQNHNITNKDLFTFGLENNFLPKHTKQVLDEINKKYPLEIVSLDNELPRSYYIGNENRWVNIKLR